MKKIISGALILFIMGLGLTACENQKSNKKRTIPNLNAQSDEPTLLGKKRANPFTIYNMRNALEKLSKGKSNGSNLIPNKLYVRFLPKNAADLKILDDQGLILSDFPLDQQVAHYGDGYQDPLTASKGTTWMYTTVNIDYRFGSVRHQLIDSLYLPSQAREDKSTALFKEFSLEDLENKALELAGYKDEVSTEEEKAEKYNPEGYVRVHQRIGSSYIPVPVKNIKVRSRWFFDYGTAYTDANGHFYISEQYRKNRNVNIIFIFENSNVNIRTIRGASFLQMFFTERNNIGEYENSALENINHLFTNNPGTSQAALNTQQKRFWIAAHAINSVYEHRAYCLNAGILTPPSNLNMWITNQNTNGTSLSRYAAAPMFKQMGNTSNLVNFAQLFLVVNGAPIYAIAMDVLSLFPPDITYNYSENFYYYEQSDVITQIFYHELSHASHFAKVGNSYWLTLGLSEVINGAAHPPYGFPTDLNAGRIALCESWAEYCSVEFAHMKYGANNSTPHGYDTWSKYIERFKPYGFGGYWRWIPDGIMHDLMDSGEPMSQTNVLDEAYGFTISQVFASLDSDVVTIPQYKTRFKMETGTWQTGQINQLFKDYGY